jgi:hypothetical protein
MQIKLLNFDTRQLNLLIESVQFYSTRFTLPRVIKVEKTPGKPMGLF